MPEFTVLLASASGLQPYWDITFNVLGEENQHKYCFITANYCINQMFLTVIITEV